jgi:hypothetical protein
MERDDDNVISLAPERSRRRGGCKCSRLDQKFEIDTEHGTVHCANCDQVVSAFHALRVVAFSESRFAQRMKSMREEYKQMRRRLRSTAWLKAARELEAMWRGKKMLPCCPHCRRGLYPEDLTGLSVSREFEAARRRSHEPTDT